MSFDAWLYFPSAATYGGCPAPYGESLIQPGAISLGEQWSFSLENKLDISSRTTGAGAGKAEFQEFTIKKLVDSASPTLLLACGSGSAFNNVQLVLRRSTGVSSSSSNSTANIFLKWTFNMFVVEKIEFSYADPSPEETITAKFGALEISYWQQSPDGQLLAKPAQQWSQVSASNDMFVGS